MLLNYIEIKTLTEQKFYVDIEDLELDDLILKSSNANKEKYFHAVENSLNIKLPNDFKSFNENYDIDDFSIVNITFGSGENYLKTIIELNDNHSFSPWWAGAERPVNKILIAYSDPFSILLDCISNEIFSLTFDGDILKISNNFELFFRGLGTIAFNYDSRENVVHDVGAQDNKFWLELVTY